MNCGFGLELDWYQAEKLEKFMHFALPTRGAFFLSGHDEAPLFLIPFMAHMGESFQDSRLDMLIPCDLLKIVICHCIKSVCIQLKG